MNGARLSSGLVNCSQHLVAAERGDHSLDLPPVAETDEVAVVTALLGTRCGLQPGVVAEAGHKV